MMHAANDNDVRVIHGSGNVFRDLGFDEAEAARAVEALREYSAKGGRSFEDFKRELDATVVAYVPRVYYVGTATGTFKSALTPEELAKW